MLSEAITQLIESTQCKKRKITTTAELDAAIEPQVILQFNINKTKSESLSLHMRVDTPPIARTFYDQYEKELQNITKYVQIQGLVNVYHALDIDVLPEAAGNPCWWQTEDNFNA